MFCGSATDRRRYGSELKPLGYNPENDRGVSTARSVKGSEFEYCFVIAPELLLKGDQTAMQFARNQIYVALSRCRRGLSVYATREFASEFVHPGVDLIAL